MAARLSRIRAKSSSSSLGTWGSRAAVTLLLIFLQGGVVMIPRSAEAATETDSYSTKELDSNFIEIHRKKHRFRHWKWSGIFPFSGGWIPDPHILATPVREFSRVISEEIGCNGTARYQGFDINPWFEDASSEVVVAIECDDTVFSYNLDLKDLQDVKYGFINGRGLFPFLRDDHLVFLTSLYISHPVFIVISLPLSHEASAVLHPLNSEGGQDFRDYVEAECRDPLWNPRLCDAIRIVRKLEQRPKQGL